MQHILQAVEKINLKPNNMKKQCFCGKSAPEKNKIVCEDFKDALCDEHFEEWKKEVDSSVRNDFMIASLIFVLIAFVAIAGKVLSLLF